MKEEKMARKEKSCEKKIHAAANMCNCIDNFDCGTNACPVFNFCLKIDEIYRDIKFPNGVRTNDPRFVHWTDECPALKDLAESQIKDIAKKMCEIN